MTIQDTIETYRKRRNQPAPLLIGIIALLLVIIGILVFILWIGGSKGAGFNLFASRTPTPTVTFTTTLTPPPSDTPTITLTPTETATDTPSGPYDYTIQQGDTLTSIVKDHNLGTNGIPLILMLNPYNPTDTTRPGIDPVTQIIYPGQKIALPNPDMPFPSATPWPTDAPSGTRLDYFVLPGDSLGSIAAKMRSTVDQIVALNKTILPNGVNTILYPGWVLVVPVNLVTVTPLPSSTRTVTETHTPGPTATLTETPTK